MVFAGYPIMQRILHLAICNCPEVQNLHNFFGCFSCFWLISWVLKQILICLKLGKWRKSICDYKPISVDLQLFTFFKLSHQSPFDFIFYSPPTPYKQPPHPIPLIKLYKMLAFYSERYFIPVLLSHPPKFWSLKMNWGNGFPGPLPVPSSSLSLGVHQQASNLVSLCILIRLPK